MFTISSSFSLEIPLKIKKRNISVNVVFCFASYFSWSADGKRRARSIECNIDTNGCVITVFDSTALHVTSAAFVTTIRFKILFAYSLCIISKHKQNTNTNKNGCIFCLHDNFNSFSIISSNLDLLEKFAVVLQHPLRKSPPTKSIKHVQCLSVIIHLNDNNFKKSTLMEIQNQLEWRKFIQNEQKKKHKYKL